MLSQLGRWGLSCVTQTGWWRARRQRVCTLPRGGQCMATRGQPSNFLPSGY